MCNRLIVIQKTFLPNYAAKYIYFLTIFKNMRDKMLFLNSFECDSNSLHVLQFSE